MAHDPKIFLHEISIPETSTESHRMSKPTTEAAKHVAKAMRAKMPSLHAFAIDGTPFYVARPVRMKSMQKKGVVANDEDVKENTGCDASAAHATCDAEREHQTS
jgi:hypothetical protein